MRGVPGYDVSDLGRVRSWKKCARFPGPLPRIMVPSGIAKYPHVIVMNDGKQQTLSIHRAVLEAFVGPCPDGMEACHGPDHTRSNCRLKNLRWDTRKNNHADMTAAGTRKRPSRTARGVAVGGARLTDELVIEIRESSASQRALSKTHGVSQSTIWRAMRLATWRHVAHA